MTWGRTGFAIALALLAAPLPTSLAPPAAAIAGTDYDTFDAVTLNEVDGLGNEIPYVGGPQQWNTPTMDTSTFTLQAGEADPPGPTNLNGCSDTPSAVYAGRTAWVRFNPGVDGKIHVRVSTPGYDSVLMVRGAAESTWGNAQFSDLPGHYQDCSDANDGPGAEAVGCAVPTPTCQYPVQAQFVYFVQVGGKCPGEPSTCAPENVPGGPTTIRLDFIPDDSDGDGVADTLDQCPNTAAEVQVNADGCPDLDGDGIADAADDCDMLPGVPDDPPYNGCPAGPDPPQAGVEPYVLILGADGDLDNASSPAVSLRLNWPKGAQSVTLSNGDGVFETRPLGPAVIPWVLRPLKAGEASAGRDVSATFKGPGVPDTFRTDGITLDSVKPTVAKASLIPAQDDWYVGVSLKDAGTGVSQVQVLDKDRKPLQRRTLCTKAQCATAASARFVTRAKPAFVSVRDAAGNVRTVRVARSGVSCAPPAYQVPRKAPKDAIIKCFTLGTVVEAKVKKKFAWGVAGLKLVKTADGRFLITDPS